MDLLLQRFVECRYGQLTDKDKQVFAELLEQPDLDIMDWIMGRTVPPSDSLQSMINMIRDVNKPGLEGNK